MNLNSSRPGFKVRIIRRKKRKKAGKIKQEVAVDAFPLALFFDSGYISISNHLYLSLL